MRPRLTLLLLLITALAFGHSARAASPFADWAVIVVAGDFHAHSGAESEVFDNGRRDLAAAFVKAGFSPANIAQFSVRPDHFKPAQVLPSTPDAIAETFTRLAAQAKGGCLVYMTSHGSPDGIVLGDQYYSPSQLAMLVDDTCADRPAVVIVSACFSGVFIPPLSASNHMVLTAARPDRTSFGCGEADRYTFFDACVLDSLPDAHDFAQLGPQVQACVATEEEIKGASPPSEPQLWIGPALRPDLPLLAFRGPP
jgi:hypothetical protein